MFENPLFEIINLTHSNLNLNQQLKVSPYLNLNEINFPAGTYSFKATFDNRHNQKVSHFYIFQKEGSSFIEIYHSCLGDINFSSSRDACFSFVGLGRPSLGEYYFEDEEVPILNENDDPYEDIVTFTIKMKDYSCQDAKLNFNLQHIQNFYFNNNVLGEAYLNDQIIFRKTLVKDCFEYHENGGDQIPNPKFESIKFGLPMIPIYNNNITNSNLPTQEDITFIFDANDGILNEPIQNLTSYWVNYPNGWILEGLSDSSFIPSGSSILIFAEAIMHPNRFDWNSIHFKMDLQANWNKDYILDTLLHFPSSSECTKAHAILLGWSPIYEDEYGEEFLDTTHIIEPGVDLYYWHEDTFPKKWGAVWDEEQRFIISHKAINETTWTVETQTSTITDFENKITEIKAYYENNNMKYDITIEYLPWEDESEGE